MGWQNYSKCQASSSPLLPRIFMQMMLSPFFCPPHFPPSPPNSFLQMMCHYKEVYLNKFNTSLINPCRGAFQKVTRHIRTALNNQPPLPPPPSHLSHHSISSRMEVVVWGDGEGDGITSRMTHLKQIFIYIFIQLLNFI